MHGGGGSSKVWIGRYNEQKVIIKVLDFYRSDGDAGKKKLTKVGYYIIIGQQRCADLCPHIMQVFCKEVMIWKNLSHPNILPFIGAALVTEERHENYEIVSEFMENGDINKFMGLNAGVNRLELVGFDSRLTDLIE